VQQQSGREHGLEIAMTETNRNTQQRLSRTNIATVTIGLALLATGITGCGTGLGTAAGNGTTTVPLLHGGITGNVHGGQQPVLGATIQLYAVGSGSLGAAASALIPTADQVVYSGPNTGALTDSSGNFQITGDYTCPTPSPQVYLVAKGGTSQGTPGSNLNSAIVLMAPLGDCSTLVQNAATTYIQLNELTTVAAAYALAPYMTGYANVGAVAVNDTGLINAVGNFNSLVNLTTGLSGGGSLPTGAVVPTTEINTLGDILATCVNTPSSSSGPCSTLQTATSAADTTGMALAFAKNPGSPTLTALAAVATSQAPFQPTLAANPSDWTVAIKYTAASTLRSPYNIAIDKVGNAWISNTAGGLVELSPAGALASTYSGGGILGPKGLAFDRTGNLWVANPTANSVVKVVPNGNNIGVASSSAFTAGGLSGPVALALDSVGNAWIANQLGNSVVELSSTGAPTTASGATGFTAGSTISGPSGIALDATGNVYVANSGGGNVVKLTNSSGAAAAGSPFTDFALQGTSSVVLDSSNNVFATGSTTGTTLAPAISQFTSAGAVASYSPVTPGVTGFYPGVVALGSSKLLLANSISSGALVLQTLGTTPTAVSYGSLNTPIGLAVDLSGNVWVADSGDNTVSVFVGLVTPVTTPLAANVGP
jgi:streptogramin lyase